MSSAVTQSEYDSRKAAAERTIDAKVDAWRQRPTLPQAAKGAAWLAGLLGTAAVIGYAMGGGTGALLAPAILHLPLLCIAGGASGMSDDEGDVRSRARYGAYEAAGLKGVRDPRLGPTILGRPATLIGRRKAEAVVEQVSANLAHGVWGQAPTTVSYCMRGHAIAPVLSPAAEQVILAEPSATKIRLLADGRALVTKHSYGRLNATSGNPSSIVLDERAPFAAAWHDAGRQFTVWTAGEKPLRLDVDAATFAGIVRESVNDVRFSDHTDALRLADALDTVADHAGKMAAEGGGMLTLSLTGGKLDLDGLKRALASTTGMDDHVGTPAAMKR